MALHTAKPGSSFGQSLNHIKSDCPNLFRKVTTPVSRCAFARVLGTVVLPEGIIGPA